MPVQCSSSTLLLTRDFSNPHTSLENYCAVADLLIGRGARGHSTNIQPCLCENGRCKGFEGVASIARPLFFWEFRNESALLRMEKKNFS